MPVACVMGTQSSWMPRCALGDGSLHAFTCRGIGGCWNSSRTWPRPFTQDVQHASGICHASWAVNLLLHHSVAHRHSNCTPPLSTASCGLCCMGGCTASQTRQGPELSHCASSRVQTAASWQRSFLGQGVCCSSGVMDASGYCCASSALDECGVCDGDGASCALHAVVNVQVGPLCAHCAGSTWSSSGHKTSCGASNCICERGCQGIEAA